MNHLEEIYQRLQKEERRLNKIINSFKENELSFNDMDYLDCMLEDCFIEIRNLKNDLVNERFNLLLKDMDLFD